MTARTGTTAPGLIDIGVNLTSKRFRSDLDQVIARALQAGVQRMVVTGLSVPLSWAAYQLASTRPGVLFSTAGVHPHNARTCDGDSIAQLRRLSTRAPVVAIGECGLDYNRNFSEPRVQRQWFTAQLQLATEVGLPVFLHERDAHRDFLAILREYRSQLVGGVVHCFTGKAFALERYLELDLHIGITGWICDDRRGRHLRSLVGRIPADRLMLETDAPFLLPPRLRDRAQGRRNEPAFLPHVLAQVASATRSTPRELAERTAATARAFFQLEHATAGQKDARRTSPATAM